MPASSAHSVNLFCLPYAGGSAHAFKRFSPFMSSRIQVVPIDLPGHGPRLMEDPCTTLEEMVEEAVNAIVPRLNRPYALFGHSLGAQLAYLLAHRLPNDGYPAPLHLFVSGKAGPAIPFRHAGIHELPREEFLAAVRSFGGLPEEFFVDPDIVDIFEPRLRADFRAVSNYLHTPQPPLPLPITVFYGDRDLYAEDEFRTWEAETLDPVDSHCFPGNHFFLDGHALEMARIMEDHLVQHQLGIRQAMGVGRR